MSEKKALRFLLGSNSPQGFVSRFDQLTNGSDGWRKYVIKGGPGSGKSTMMRKISARFRDLDQELIACSSDMDSLDGVIIPDLKFCIVDGTPPHAVEPQYPGAVETIVNIGACWNDELLYRNRREIIRLARAVASRHEYCCRFLNAAESLSGDTYRLALEGLDTEKLAAYCGRLSEREFRPLRKTPGTESVRLLSAVTNQGVYVFTDTAKTLCDKIYIVSDEQSAVSRILLHALRSRALAAGYNVISSYCPLSPYEKLEHLLVPELRLGFMTSNRQHDLNFDISAYRTVNSQRFLDQSTMKKHKRRFSFNRRAQAQMVEQAGRLLREAKELHDELECYYQEATDFGKVDALTQQVIAKVEQI